MAEGDRFEKAFVAGWRGAYQRVREGSAPPAEVADKLVGALSKTLRDKGGVPGLPAMIDVVINAAWRFALQSSNAGEEATILIESLNALDRIVRGKGGHRNTQVAAEAARSLLAQQGTHTNGNGAWPTAEHFVENVCKNLIDHYFFATARQNLVTEGKLGNHEQARQWQQHMEEVMGPSVRQVAERLVKDPLARTLRAPQHTVKRQSTSDLLGEVLVSTAIQSPKLGGRGR